VAFDSPPRVASRAPPLFGARSRQSVPRRLRARARL